jgi:hypothetical protein
VTEQYRTALDAALREYEALLAERARIEARMGQLAQTIGSLMRLCNLQPTVQWGLTDAVRSVLKAAGGALAAVEVRDRLAAMGFDVSRYSNDLAAIHTVLKRLNRAGEAEFAARARGGPTAYRWRRPASVISLTKEQAELLAGAGSRRRTTGRKKK